MAKHATTNALYAITQILTGRTRDAQRKWLYRHDLPRDPIGFAKYIREVLPAKKKIKLSTLPQVEASSQEASS